ncbi:CAP domain-containing protein [Lactifluus subvellereus]|nr:CAP domain-containing protein [Lactifluus subvellereus]
MLRLTFLFVALALVPSHGVFGAPSCPQGIDGDACIPKCKPDMGGPGNTMPNHRRGTVGGPSKEDIDHACGGSGNTTGFGPAFAVHLSPPAGTSTRMPLPIASNTNDDRTRFTPPVPRNPVISPAPSSPSISSPIDSAMELRKSPAEPPKGINGPVPNPPPPTSTPAFPPGPISSPPPEPTPSSIHPPHAPPNTPGSSTPLGRSDSVSSADIAAYLSAHNDIRNQHGAAPLAWSEELSGIAKQWADKCVFKHSNGSYGENIAAGTGDFTIADAIKSWTDGASAHDPNKPKYSHFMQVVRNLTTEVGCAVQSCHGTSGLLGNFYVCEYNTLGNVIGELAKILHV